MYSDYDAVRRERTWPVEYIPRLRLLGQAFASALSRARGEEVLQRTQQMLATAQRIAQTGSYERELATYAFTASAEKRAASSESNPGTAWRS